MLRHFGERNEKSQAPLPRFEGDGLLHRIRRAIARGLRAGRGSMSPAPPAPGPGSLIDIQIAHMSSSPLTGNQAEVAKVAPDIENAFTCQVLSKRNITQVQPPNPSVRRPRGRSIAWQPSSSVHKK
ncbi:hypothetical protein MES5069_110105 [Mesorhizobium escarrei]|uniref:Uncharacterized protein n=1 Tax=Mesorhizobium escarrei TaxID=666018 RepID=A0ABM9DG64_9HYPH|nr:hypothetical protein MES5069_110105 [Mesorhizobium escarrei]